MLFYQFNPTLTQYPHTQTHKKKTDEVRKCERESEVVKKECFL